MEAVIKVGGSLLGAPRALKALANELNRLAQKHSLIVVPGGGIFADAVRQSDAMYGLPSEVSHKMAIVGMDQYGLLLSNLIPHCQTFEAIDDAKSFADQGHVAVFLPSKLMNEKNPFEPSWDVTSDSVTAHIALFAGIPLVIFVTDVDGIFINDPRQDSTAKLLSEVSVDELLRFKRRTSVDKFLPQLLLKRTLDCYVVNGNYPDRVAAILAGQKTVATHILPNV